MNLEKNWQDICHMLDKAFASLGHYAVATVSEDGTPNVAPIGSLCLRDDGTGFYFEVFVSQTTKNIEHNSKICIVLTNGAMGFWSRSLFLGRFDKPCGVKLYGKVIGERRAATDKEIQMFRKRIRRFKLFKGCNLLWKDFKYVRDVEFNHCEPINLGVMGHNNWDLS